MRWVAAGGGRRYDKDKEEATNEVGGCGRRETIRQRQRGSH